MELSTAISPLRRHVFGGTSRFGDFTLHTHDNQCHAVDSQPPVVPAPHHEVRSAAFELVSADGARSPSFEAYPRSTVHPSGVVILPDIRGAHSYYQGLARRFAEAGHPAIVIDYYGRHTERNDRDADFEWQPLFPRVRAEDIDIDAAAAIARLREHGVAAVTTVGFCFGGAHSWRLGSTDLGLAGVAGFYGPPRFVGDAVDRIHTPVLMLLAGDDVATTPEEFDAFTQRLLDRDVNVQRHDYTGAPHSFFDVAFDEWKPACTDAWNRLLSFTGAPEVTSS